MTLVEERGTIWLNAYAARSCAVKTHNLYDPTVPGVEWQPDEGFQKLFNGGDGFESAIVERLRFAAGASMVDLRAGRDLPTDLQLAATRQAVQDRVDLVVGAMLPPDPRGGRLGAVDLLIRGADRPDGSPGYHAGEIKWHKLHERKTLTRVEQPNTSLLLGELVSPRPEHAVRKWGYGFRLSSREADLLQVAHYQRMLEAAGWAAPGAPLAALIGTDDWSPQTTITWVDLDQQMIKTFSRSTDGGWTSRSALERYDHEFEFRTEVAEVARQQAQAQPPEPLVEPVVIRECSRCEWWDHCRSQLDPDDVSLRIGSGALDVREITTLREHGISTVRQLAVADVDEVEPWYLPEVSHRSYAAERLRQAMRRARMLIDGVDFVRTTEGPVEVPAFDLEIDFDIETAAGGQVYLWGFLINEAGRPPTYRPFARFEDLSPEAELELAREALSWLRDQVIGSTRSVGIYHYSGFEVSHLHRLAEASDDELFGWIDDFAAGRPVPGADGNARGGFVDLLPVIKDNFFGARGLGLKVVATGGADFAWRDADPGGLNSQHWFLDAVHAEHAADRVIARQRVLDYNEDDVRATQAVRHWLRSQT